MRNINRIGIVAIFLLLFFYIAYQKYKQKSLQLNIKSNLEYSYATIIECNVTHRGSVWIKYNYFYQNNILQNKQNISISLWKANKLINKKFPIVLSNKNPKDCTILIFPKDFEEYNIPFPDSLNWVKELLDK